MTHGGEDTGRTHSILGASIILSDVGELALWKMKMTFITSTALTVPWNLPCVESHWKHVDHVVVRLTKGSLTATVSTLLSGRCPGDQAHSPAVSTYSGPHCPVSGHCTRICG